MEKINVKNLMFAFANYNKSFAAAIRYIAEVAKSSAVNVPAAPAKDDKSDEAKALRKEIKNAEAANKMIEDCKTIVDTFAITANDLRAKNIGALRAKVMQYIDKIDADGRAVKFAKLPSYLKSEVKEYAIIMQVVPATWVETICAAAENKLNDFGGMYQSYDVTIAPVISEGEIVEPANGDIVDLNGNIIGSKAIFTTWEREAKIRNIANAVGRDATAQSISEQKAAK